MRPSLRWIGVLFLLLIAPVSSFADELKYPSSQVERPLTLPDGMWELGAGIEYIKWAESSDTSVYPALSLRYGITDNLEFYLIGLRYRIVQSDPFELAVKGRVAGFGHSTIDGTIIMTEIGAEAKQRINPAFALLYKLEDYSTYYSRTPDRTDLRLSLGGLVSFTEKLALELRGTYRRLEEFNESDARVLTTVLYYTVSPAFDIRLWASFSDYSQNERDRDRAESYKQLYGIIFSWRY